MWFERGLTCNPFSGFDIRQIPHKNRGLSEVFRDFPIPAFPGNPEKSEVFRIEIQENPKNSTAHLAAPLWRGPGQAAARRERTQCGRRRAQIAEMCQPRTSNMKWCVASSSAMLVVAAKATNLPIYVKSASPERVPGSEASLQLLQPFLLAKPPLMCC